jgi:hypothetical protein
MFKFGEVSESNVGAAVAEEDSETGSSGVAAGGDHVAAGLVDEDSLGVIRT